MINQYHNGLKSFFLGNGVEKVIINSNKYYIKGQKMKGNSLRSTNLSILIKEREMPTNLINTS